MSKKKKEKKTSNNKENITISIDCDELARSLIKAKSEVDNKQEEQNKIEAQKLLQKRKEILGEKDFSHIKNKVWREVRKFLNDTRVVWKMLTMSKEEAVYFTAVGSLTKMLTTFLLFVLGLVFYLIAGVLLYFSFSSRLLSADGIIISILLVALGRMLRIARFEVERLDDNGYLISICTLVISVVALLVAFVGVIVGIYGVGG